MNTKNVLLLLCMLAFSFSGLKADTSYRKKMDQGIRLLISKKYDKALEVFRQVEQKWAETAEVHFHIGNVQAARHQVKDAIVSFSRAIELNPDYKFAYINRGAAYYAIGHKFAAINDYSSAIDLDPTYVIAYANRAIAYLETGRPFKALDDFDVCIALNPSAKNYRNRARLQTLIEDYEAAITDYKRAVILEPDNDEALNSIGWIYATARDENYRKPLLGIAFARKALSIEEKARYYDTIAAAYAEAGWFDLCVEASQKAIELAPDKTSRYTYKLLLDEAYSKGKTFYEWESEEE